MAAPSLIAACGREVAGPGRIASGAGSIAVDQALAPDLVCNRTDKLKVPTSGEHCCTTSRQTLCWDTGPIREDTKDFFFNSDEIPRYFELTTDYEIPIAAFFSDPPPVSFPSFARVVGDGDPDTKRERLAPLVDDLPIIFAMELSALIDTRKWDFVEYVDGKLIIKEGYRWDGASVGWDRKYFDDRLLRTYLVDMRASLVHDVFYDLIRLGILRSNTTDKAPLFGGTNDYRNVADILFYLTAKEDGHSDGLQVFFKTLRRLGQTKARLHAEDNAAWRFHTLADASVSADGTAMGVDEEGNKYIALSCANANSQIELDAGYSRPIAIAPMAGKYSSNLDLHDTSWEWTLNGQLITQGVHEYPTGDLLSEPDKFKTNVTVDSLINLGLSPGDESFLLLRIDEGKDNDEAFFSSTDAVRLSVEVDDVPPVIDAVFEPVIAWPPNHEYRTFTINDLVRGVSDNCTAISEDDLLIVLVTSNEPDDGIGDGHTKNDIVIAADGKSVDLRIERNSSFKDNGRVYTIHIQATDEAGNSTTVPAEVHVPRNSATGN